MLFAQSIFEVIEQKLEIETIINVIEKPKKRNLGDLAFPCFILGKQLRQSPVTIAQDLSTEISNPIFRKVSAVGPYINIFFDQEKVSQQVLDQIIQEGSRYGGNNNGKDQLVPIDFSAPNIAKPFSMGHLRSTVIGNSIANIAEKNGYQTLRINHLGDWGTQFGKLIVAYQKWGDIESIKQNSISELLRLYVKFHEEAKLNPTLDDEGRQAFKKLEDGDSKARELWEWFRTESLQEFSRIYDLLDIQFDSYNGEAFYNDKMQPVIDLLEDKKLLVESEGAQVVLLEDDMPPCLIKKSDGATLYATRDLAAAIYRKKHYNFAKSLYVVGSEQSLHFKQLKLVLQKAGFDWSKDMKHIAFGMILQDGKKMSTRKGRIILLENVLKETIQLTKKIIEEKNPSLKDKEKIAHQVGIGAVIFNDLKNFRTNDVEFSFDAMLNFDGETGPYLQYTYARCQSLLRRAHYTPQIKKSVLDERAWPIVSLFADFPSVIQHSWAEFDPSKIARFSLDLARAFNQYYAHVHILSDPENQEARLNLVYATSIILKESLRLLGLQTPVEM